MLNRKHYSKAVEAFNFTPDIDCFASRINCQHKCYVSFRPDPYASFVDAFSINWTQHNCYVFPPFSMIGRVLQKIRIDKATVLCVFPHWPTQAWWPQMTRMTITDSLILNPSPFPLIWLKIAFVNYLNYLFLQAKFEFIYGGKNLPESYEISCTSRSLETTRNKISKNK